MRAAVLGHPIAHSLSPVLHRAAYRALGLEGWSYDAYDVEEAAFPGWLAEQGLTAPDGGGWAGLSLTMPLKRAALAAADEAEPLARAVGAANTLYRRDGGWTAANTDVAGIAAALAEAAGPRGGPRGPGASTAARAVDTAGAADSADSAGAAGAASLRADRPAGAVVLGAGATGASALAALHGQRTGHIEVWARNLASAGAHELLEAAARLGATFDLVHWDGTAIPRAGTVISTLPAHAADPLAGAIAREAGSWSGRVLLDVAYAPWPSALARAWWARGGLVASGRDMLLHQAARQVELMTGRPAPLAAMRQALEG